MSCSTFVHFFRQKIYPPAYQITTFLFSKSGQNLKTVKCVSNFTKWFVMMINACDHLDSCIFMYKITVKIKRSLQGSSVENKHKMLRMWMLG